MTACIYGVYRDHEQLLSAVRALASAGHHCSEAYTPHPVEYLSDALGQEHSPIPVRTFWVGLAASAVTYFVQWLINDYLYPINVGARPPHFPLSYVPVCFEMGMLFAALTAFTGVLTGGKLGRLWQPVFEQPGFESALRDRYWLELRLDAPDELEDVVAALHASGAEQIMRAEEGRCGA